MRRREFLLSAAATATALSIGTAKAADPIKIGVVGPKTGGMASGAECWHGWRDSQVSESDTDAAGESWRLFSTH